MNNEIVIVKGVEILVAVVGLSIADVAGVTDCLKAGVTAGVRKPDDPP